ncbi:hypothetical protein EH223_12415 [candidate division KSB1 bacterium]|nr:hypothetical protein [candidate division KSB1 bacterium]RQW02499.1 MAG: hypothetical protein EH223_12415 [candidate division KSB1 bacterium]
MAAYCTIIRLLKDKPGQQDKIVLFESKNIRRIWHNDEWYFSVIDVCGALTDAPDDLTARKYRNKLAQRLRAEGSKVVTNCHRLKWPAQVGSDRVQQIANPELAQAVMSSVMHDPIFDPIPWPDPIS